MSLETKNKTKKNKLKLKVRDKLILYTMTKSNTIEKLVIVESPAKCAKIEKYLGDGYKVIGSFGHITELSDLKQIDFNNNFKPTYKTIESKKSQIAKLRTSIKAAKEVIIATDDDREGEAIGYALCQVFGLNVSTTKRIIFHEITQKALHQAIINPTTINLDLVNAQQGRQILDLIVGYKLSPILWKNISFNAKNALSAGRCQTPALRLVYDNYKEIKDSPGKRVYGTTGIFTDKNISFTLSHEFETNTEVITFLQESKIFQHILSREKEKETKKNPPLPFTTSALQQTANTVINMSPKETMSIAQKLYESGYITYMRTDSRYYSEDFINIAHKYITAQYDDLNQSQNGSYCGILSQNPKTKKAKSKDNNAQEAHEAIRITNIETTKLNTEDKSFNAKHAKLYKLIWNNTIESLMSPAIYKQFTTIISAPQKYVYKCSSEMNIFPGWKIIQGVEVDKNYNYLVNLCETKVNYKRIVSKETIKDLKTHYNEARLVLLLEQSGIGRPSTFSSLVEKIQERGYVSKQNVEGIKVELSEYCSEGDEIRESRGDKIVGNEKNKLVITQLGIVVIEFLIEYFNELFEYGYTKQMEDKLDIIAHGEMKYWTLCGECNDFIETLSKKNTYKSLEGETTKEKNTIKLDDKHTYYIGKNGPIIKYIKDDGSTGFYNVKPDIDVEKLRRGEYEIQEIIKDDSRCLGVYKGNEVYLKVGKFGHYIECGETKRSLNVVKINVPYKSLTLEDAISILETTNDNTLVRKISDNVSIRKGKYGDYIFHKTPKMRKPEFLKLKDFDDDYKTCSLEYIKKWLKETYNISG